MMICLPNEVILQIKIFVSKIFTVGISIPWFGVGRGTLSFTIFYGLLHATRMEQDTGAQVLMKMRDVWVDYGRAEETTWHKHAIDHENVWQ